MYANTDQLIWSDDPYYTEDIDEYKERMEEEMPGELDGMSDDAIYERMADELSENLDCERSNLDLLMNRPIIVLGTLGLWDGRHTGYSIQESFNIKDCLQSRLRSASYNTFYVSAEGELCQDECHHDGTNSYIYRVVDDGLTGEEQDDFMDALRAGGASQKFIMEHTKPLGGIVAHIYGWDLISE